MFFVRKWNALVTSVLNPNFFDTFDAYHVYRIWEIQSGLKNRFGFFFQKKKIDETVCVLMYDDEFF